MSNDEILPVPDGDEGPSHEVCPNLKAEGVPPIPDVPNPDRPKLTAAKLLVPKHKVDLSTASLGPMPETIPVEQLEIREMRGIGVTFTPNLAEAQVFKGLVHQPEGEFETTYQIIAGSLLHDQRILSRSRSITFIPSFSWQTCEVVIVPFKSTRYGTRVLQTLRSMHHRFPAYKVYVEWNELKRRQVVHEMVMTPEERELISRIIWPTRAQVIEALQMSAYDNLDELAAANEKIRILLQSREVE